MKLEDNDLLYLFMKIMFKLINICKLILTINNIHFDFISLKRNVCSISKTSNFIQLTL